ncbi:MetQ/NlpA family ABC transporter substrate-binding protein [Ferdinandcohnia quinoae]|uniref:Lipoprotein n=1 Tax=Fredinandcohnia quinoae TaxID=2918902 RepID=A0AAW5E9Z8_9BACI|nr:MetQ/NlpA family ABC transporter substrate-binding protein [Fredinandcohnia sp. SECRCQ15]MCH1625569.1 MetQ/NlpA family ABC transporter substrate-binding protein [Fredinandcohnia sp. SECRCQ15]
MKKFLQTIILLALVFSLAACGASKDEGAADKSKNGEGEAVTIKIGATPVPHVEILEEAKPLLKEKGFDLEIEEFTDYALPNMALNEGELDANFFQHIPYLNKEIDEKGYDLVNAGGIHIEPIGLYTKKYKSIDELPKGATVIMSNSVADHGRVLAMLEKEGLIKIKEGIEKVSATTDDIVENEKDLQFQTDLDAALLTKIYEGEEGDLVAINGNYALDAGLNPSKDALIIESPENNPYVNVIAVPKGEENSEAIKALLEVLHSDEITKFIEEKYNGSVIPANE